MSEPFPASNRSSFLTAIELLEPRRFRLVDAFLRALGRVEVASLPDNLLALAVGGDLSTAEAGESLETGELESPPSEALKDGACADLGLVTEIEPIPAR